MYSAAPALTIFTLTVPAACGGAVQFISVDETREQEAALPPNVTAVVLSKPVPVIMMDVPLVTGPLPGET